MGKKKKSKQNPAAAIILLLTTVAMFIIATISVNHPETIPRWTVVLYIGLWMTWVVFRFFSLPNLMHRDPEAETDNDMPPLTTKRIVSLLVLQLLGPLAVIIVLVQQFGSEAFKAAAFRVVGSVAPFVIIGAFAVVSVMSFLQVRKAQRRLDTCIENVPGVVSKIQHREVTSHIRGRFMSETAYVPVMRYRVNGIEYEGESEEFASFDSAKVGDVIELVVNPDEPTTFYYKEVLENGRSSALAFAVVFAGVAIFCAYGFLQFAATHL